MLLYGDVAFGDYVMPYSDVASVLLYDILEHAVKKRTVILNEEGRAVGFSRTCPVSLKEPHLWIWFRARNEAKK